MTRKRAELPIAEVEAEYRVSSEIPSCVGKLYLADGTYWAGQSVWLRIHSHVLRDLDFTIPQQDMKTLILTRCAPRQLHQSKFSSVKGASYSLEHLKTAMVGRYAFSGKVYANALQGFVDAVVENEEAKETRKSYLKQRLRDLQAEINDIVDTLDSMS
jgi:hypothetical protein